jgi:hypothetical protein
MFFHLLDPLEQEGAEFWAESVDKFAGWSPGERAPILEKSAKVVHDWIYSEWPDPMEGQPRFSDEEIDKLWKFRWRGLGELLKADGEKFNKTTRDQGEDT